MGKATGPRTPKGKARSSQNAAKHWLQSKRILPEEEKEAAILRNGFTENFKPRGLMESEIIDDLVFNRLNKRRIDVAYTREFAKASAQKSIDWLENRERTVIQFLQRAGASGERLRPDLCVGALEHLKREIRKRGPQPSEDVFVLHRVYGQKPTEHAAALIFDLRLFADGQPPEGKGTEESQRLLTEEILQSLDKEIAQQNQRAEVEQQILDAESDIQEPEALVLDMFLRYRAANTREFKDLINILSSIRNLPT